MITVINISLKNFFVEITIQIRVHDYCKNVLFFNFLYFAFRLLVKPQWHDLLPCKLGIWFCLTLKALPHLIQVKKNLPLSCDTTALILIIHEIIYACYLKAEYTVDAS